MPLKEFTKQINEWVEESLERKANIEYPWEILNLVSEQRIMIGGGTEAEGLLRRKVITGITCKIGKSSEVKDSVIMDFSYIPHHNYVGDSVIGSECNLGAGAKIANFRLDGKEISVDVESKRYKLERQKFGAILENGVKVGCNAVICPGSYISENSYIGPGVVVYGYVPPNSRIKENYRNRYD